MPGTTTKGWPYILGADSADTIDDTSLTLANKLEAVVPYSMASGSVSIVLTNISSATATVTFPTNRFTVAPLVQLTKNSSSGSAIALIPMYYNATSSSMTVGLYHAAGTAVTVTVTLNWWAVQMTTAAANG